MCASMVQSSYLNYHGTNMNMNLLYMITKIDKGLINGLYVVEEKCGGVLHSVKSYKDPSHQILHGNGDPSDILFHDDGTIKSHVYHMDGKIFRDNDLPPLISYYRDGTTCKW